MILTYKGIFRDAKFVFGTGRKGTEYWLEGKIFGCMGFAEGEYIHSSTIKDEHLAVANAAAEFYSSIFTQNSRYLIDLATFDWSTLPAEITLETTSKSDKQYEETIDQLQETLRNADYELGRNPFPERISNVHKIITQALKETSSPVEVPESKTEINLQTDMKKTVTMWSPKSDTDCYITGYQHAISGSEFHCCLPETWDVSDITNVRDANNEINQLRYNTGWLAGLIHKEKTNE